MIRYMSLKELAARINVQAATAAKYELPEPDALTGEVRGWLPETVDAWHAARPGKGAGAGRKPNPRQ